MSSEDEFLRAWHMAREGNSVRVGSLAVLLWDLILTLEDERELFWKKPCSFATCLFYLSRYLTILVSLFGVIVSLSHPIPDSACFTWFLIEGFLGMVCCWSVQIILQLRLFALYDRSLQIKIILIISFFAQLGAIIGIFIHGARSGKVQWVSVGILSQCQVLNVASNFWAFWVTLLCYEFFLCCLALNKGYERLRASNHRLVTWPGFRVGLQDVLVRDSVGYYIGCCTIYAINLSLWVESLPDSFDLATGLGVAYPSLIGNRLMINLRRVYYDSQVSSASSPSEISLPCLDQVLGRGLNGSDKLLPYSTNHTPVPSLFYASTQPPIPRPS